MLQYILYFIKCVFLTQENYAFVHSTDQKNRLHTSDFAYSSLHFKLEWRNWSLTFFIPLSSAPFYTHKQINVASQHILKLFPSEKNAAVFRAGPLTRPPAGGVGSQFCLVLRQIMLELNSRSLAETLFKGKMHQSGLSSH